MKRCPLCGQEMAKDATICHRCGHEFEKEAQVSPPADTGRSNTLLWLLLAGGVLVGLLLVFVFQSGWAPVPDSPPPRPTTAASTTPTRNTSVPLNPVVSQVLAAPRVYDHDNFAELVEARWYYSDPSVTTTDGQLSITGVQPWASWWGAKRTFEEGDAVLVLFQPKMGSQFEFHLERGEWATAAYRRWAFHIGNRFEMSITEGSAPQRWAELVGQVSLDPETWYYLLLGIDLSGEFVAFMWEREASAAQLAYRSHPNDGWVGPGWVFGMGANRGEVVIDAITEITFSDAHRPDPAGEHFWRAMSHLERQEPDEALEALNEALRLDSGNDTYLYYRGMTAWRMGHVDRAMDDLERAAALDPGNDEYLRRLALLLATERDEMDTALELVEQALSLAPLESRNYRLRGIIIRDVQQDYPSALADFDRAIELSPREAELYRLRGETHNLMDEYAAGLEDGIECALLQPEDAACTLQQARSYVGLNDSEGAVEAYRRFLDTTDRVVCPDCRQEAQSYIEQFD